MTNRTNVGVLLLALAAGLTGCDADRRPGPSGPSPVPQSGPPPTPTGIHLAGTVSDAAWRPLTAARVEVVNGPHAGLSTTTDAQGNYRLIGTFDDTTHFRATKEGHVAATWPFPAICDRCNPPWWLHFYLETLAPPANIAGDYTLTFIADSTCTGLPKDSHTRTYAATVTLTSRAGEPANSRFDVTVRGATFLDHFNSFTIGVAGDYLMTDLGDGHGAPGLVEQVAPNTYLTLSGAISTTVTDTSTISGAFVGAVERCELTSEWGPRYSCADEAISRVHCESHSHRLILSRR